LFAPIIKTKTDGRTSAFFGNLLGFFTDAPFGTSELINSFKNANKSFYLVEDSAKQFFVIVTDEVIEIRQPFRRITEDKFEFGDFKFRKCKYKVK